MDDIEFAQLRRRLIDKIDEAVRVNQELAVLERQVQAEEERRSLATVHEIPRRNSDPEPGDFRPRPSGGIEDGEDDV